MLGGGGGMSGGFSGSSAVPVPVPVPELATIIDDFSGYSCATEAVEDGGLKLKIC